ncbi:MAG TPA: hypothetical protein VNX68_17870 [Nitrosopumilaceae archaeon]|nr:hypothetical protein [Nitrosopumilaceae archaeon]
MRIQVATESNNNPSGSAALEDNALSSDDILDILSDESDDELSKGGSDEKVTEKKGKEVSKEGKDAEESRDEEEQVDEEEEKKEIKLEDTEDDDLKFLHVNRREILKAYPDLFKKFPSLEKSIYREQEYAQIFPTMAEARESKEALDNYTQIESGLLSGDIGNILSAVKNSDARAFDKITETFLPTLSKIDAQAYSGVLSQVLKSAAISMFTEGKKRENENLQLAAQILHEFAFGDNKITAYNFRNKVSTETNPKEEELNQREQGFLKQQFDVAIGDVSGRAENIIKSTIDKHIDPKNVMTSYVRNNAMKDIMNEVDRNIKGDKTFTALLDKLWERSFEDNFSESSKIKIKNALLSKASTILPDILRKVRADALKGHTTSRRKDEEEIEDKKPLPRGNVAGSSKNSSGSKSKDGRGMKTADFFLQD